MRLGGRPGRSRWTRRRRTGPAGAPGGVARAHMETVTAFDGGPEDVRLGTWVATTRRAQLPAERNAESDALGMRRP